MPGLPFERLPMSPESMAQQEFETGQQQIDEQYKIQWDQLNKQYQISGDSEKLQQEQDKLMTKGRQEMLQYTQEYEQRVQRFKDVDDLAAQGHIQNAPEIKWRIGLEAEEEKAMFPEQVDWRAEHGKNLREQYRLMDARDSFTLDRSGRLFWAKTDDKDRPIIGSVDKKRPATPEEMQMFKRSLLALDEIQRLEREQILPNLAPGDILPTRLQKLMLGQRQKSWMSKVGSAIQLATPGFRHIPVIKTFGKEDTPGTLSDKVSQSIVRPEPEGTAPDLKVTRRQMLTEYNRLGGSRTTEGREFADRYLR